MRQAFCFCLLIGAATSAAQANSRHRRSILSVTNTNQDFGEGGMKKMYGLVATIGLWPWAGATSAADTRSASDEDQGTLTEIVVIAQKRTENLQNVPIAISTVSGSQLAAVAASSITAIADMTPGLQMTTTQGSLAPHIRGVGSDIPNVENSVALYLDGVYIGSPSAALLSLNNIQQIETLKGPQGTLFGRTLLAARRCWTGCNTTQLSISAATSTLATATFRPRCSTAMLRADCLLI